MTTLMQRVARVLERASGGRLLAVDYPVRPRPRYGHGKPPHPELMRRISARHQAFVSEIAGWEQYEDRFRAIPARKGGDATAPYWLNGWLPALDAAALYGFITTHRSRRYTEIGSGHSTAFARRAISDAGLATTITSIDPQPRAEIDAICDRVVRSPLEDADLSVFDGLAEGDIVFFDGSHRVFPNSDVAVFFLDVLPRMAPGVLVQVHDIQLPYDYAPELARRYYSEQYMLAAHLLASERTEILFASAYASENAECQALLRTLWKRPGLDELEPWGGSFWFRMTPKPEG